jgi:hypothetical protein
MSRRVLANIVGAVLGLAAAGCCAAVSLRPVVPDRLDVDPEQPVAPVAHASGVQIYACTAGSDAARYAWSLKAPEADLFDDSGRRIGSHYGGPTWEATDGSKVVGAVKARIDASLDDTIPWLLLAATSNSGSGVFARVASIQRIDTRGGLAPRDAAYDESRIGNERRVPYTATYVFYNARG